MLNLPPTYLPVGIALLFAGGCASHDYHLPGHTSRNLANPPDVSLQVGDSIRAVSTASPLRTSLMTPIAAWSMLEIENPEVARITDDDSKRARLQGVSLGKTTANYKYLTVQDGDAWVSIDEESNYGFTIFVTP